MSRALAPVITQPQKGILTPSPLHELPVRAQGHSQLCSGAGPVRPVHPCPRSSLFLRREMPLSFRKVHVLKEGKGGTADPLESQSYHGRRPAGAGAARRPGPWRRRSGRAMGRPRGWEGWSPSGFPRAGYAGPGCPRSREMGALACHGDGWYQGTVSTIGGSRTRAGSGLTLGSESGMEVGDGPPHLGPSHRGT